MLIGASDRRWLALIVSQPETLTMQEQHQSIGEVSAGRRSGTQCLDRAIALLVEISERSPIGCRLVDLADATGVSRPTAHRLLGRLVASGLVIQEHGTHLYKAGPFTHTLESMNARNAILADAGMPSLERIVAEIDHTVLLVTRSGRFSQCCARVDGRELDHPSFGRVGRGGLLGPSASGIAILAGLRSEQIDDILFENEWMLSEYGGVSIETFRKLIADTKKRGFAMTQGQFVPGISGIAVAVPAPLGRCFASLSIVTVCDTLSSRDVRQAVALIEEEAETVAGRLACTQMFSWLRAAPASP